MHVYACSPSVDTPHTVPVTVHKCYNCSLSYNTRPQRCFAAVLPSPVLTHLLALLCCRAAGPPGLQAPH